MKSLQIRKFVDSGKNIKKTVLENSIQTKPIMLKET